MGLTDDAVRLIGVGIGAVLITFGGWWGNRKSSGAPPADRPPSITEIKEALSDIRRLVERRSDDSDDDHRQISRQLDRIETRLSLSSEYRGSRKDRAAR